MSQGWGPPPGGGYPPPPQAGYGQQQQQHQQHQHYQQQQQGWGHPHQGGWQNPGPYGHAMVNPYAYGVDPMTGLPYSDKTKLAAGLLGILLGKFGVGRFYMGDTGLGVAQLVTCFVGVWILSWFTCGLTALVLLWPIIDGIIILANGGKDAQGRPLRPG